MVYAAEDGDWTDWQEETEINVSIIGNPVIDLDSTERLIRAYVEIINFDPRDGYYFMQIIQPGTGKTIAEQEIIIRQKSNDDAGTSVAYLIDDDDITDNGNIVTGDYQILITTEYGSSFGSANFSVIKTSEQEFQSSLEQLAVEESSINEDVEKTPAGIQSAGGTIKESESGSVTNDPPRIPDWIKNIFVLYIEGSISEDELLAAIEFLIQQEIIIV